jgi:hypothetical protein
MSGVSNSDWWAPLARGTRTHSQVQQFIEDYVSFMIRVSELPYPAVGSLVRSPEGGGVTVGPLASGLYFNRLDPPYFFGPFRSVKERYVTQCDYMISMIGEDFYSEDCELARFVYSWVKELVLECKEMEGLNASFFIKHGDEGCSQFLLDNDRLTAFLDWEW